MKYIISYLLTALCLSANCQSITAVTIGRNTGASQYFIVASTGDSIDRGTSSGGQVGPTTAAGTCYEWDGTQLVELTTQDVSAAVTGSPWKQFALDHNANTGKIVVLVCGGSGGAEFYPNGDNNNWSASGTLRAAFETKLNSCLAYFGKQIPDAWFSILGVNDARGAQSLSNIQSASQSYIDWIQTNWPGTTILHAQVGISENSTNGNRNTARIMSVRTYVRDLAKNNPNVHLVGSLPSFNGAGYYDTDNIHLTQAGNNELGKMFARWFQNTTYNKWARSLVSSFFTDISSSRKTLINNFIDAEIANGNYFKYDLLNSFKNEDVKNIYVDWTFLQGPSGVGSPTFTANGYITTNGTTGQYWKTGHTPSINSYNISQNSVNYGLKIRTRVTSSGTLAVAMGVNDGTQRVMIGQNTTPAVAYFVHNNAISTSTSPDVALANDALYAVIRSGSATNIMVKNTTTIDAVGSISVGLPSYEITIGANNVSNVLGTPFSGTYEYYWGGSHTINHNDAYNNMETVIDNW